VDDKDPLQAARLVIIQVERSDIEEGNIEPLVGVLSTFISSREVIQSLQGKVEIVIHGYDNDPRALADIHEVREFLRRLDAVFPYWFWFLSTMGDGLKLMFLCLAAVSPLEGGQRAFHPNDLMQFLLSHFASMNELFQRFGLPPGLNKRVSDNVTDYFINLAPRP